MSARWMGVVFFVFAALIATGCQEASHEEQEDLGVVRSAVVYGDDDRRDVYAHSDARMRTIANNSAVVLVWPKYLDESDPNAIKPSEETPTLGDYKKLCSTEPFRADPALGSCSGALIDDDLVLTAAHCVPTQKDCDDVRFIFRWQRDSEGQIHHLTKDDVFRCKERVVLVTEGSGTTAKNDYAVVKIDRAATPRFQPTAIRRSPTLLVSGATVGIIGYNNGIPAKIDTGGSVLSPGSTEQGYFVHTSDAYSSNSGSPIFDLATYEIVGILARGQADDYVQQGACFVNHKCPAGGGAAAGCTGMESDYAYKAVKDLCSNAVQAAAHPKLCAAESSCGNGRCEASETQGTCPADCEASSTSLPGEGAPDAFEVPTNPASKERDKASPRDRSPVKLSSGCHISTPLSESPALLAPLLLVMLARLRRSRSRSTS